MKLIFLTLTTIGVVTDFDEAADEITGDADETFNAGDTVEVELLDETDEIFIVQFGDGSVGNIPKEFVMEQIPVTEFAVPADEVAAQVVVASPVLLEDAVANTVELADEAHIEDIKAGLKAGGCPQEVLNDAVREVLEAEENDEDEGLLTDEERTQLAEEMAARKQTQQQQPEQ